MKILFIAFFVFLLNSIYGQSWEQPVWILESPQYVGVYEESGYKFEIIKEKKSQHLVFYKEEGRWKCKLLDHVGREYEKAMPDEVDELVYFFQDIKGGVNLITMVSETEIGVYKLLSSGFALRKKACISGNGFTAFSHSPSSERLYFATRNGGNENSFSSLVIFDVAWKRKEESGKNAWHCFYEQVKGVKKGVLLHSMVVEISNSPKGVVLLTNDDESFLIGDLKFGKEALGQRDTFKCEELK